MLFRTMLLALTAGALANGVAWAQSPQPPADAENLQQKIHDELTAKGFTDVKVVPQSFLISAKDKNGNPIVMLVGPNSMTVLSGPPSGDPNTAESKDGEKKPVWQ